MRVWLTSLILTLGLATCLPAATIQYVTATGVITGLGDAPIPSVPGYSQIVLPEAAASVQLPLPSNCTARDPEWLGLGIYLVTNPATVAADGTGLGLRPGVTCFRNRLVMSAADVDAVVNLLITEGWDALTGGKINDLSVILALVANVRCPTAGMNTTCDNLRTQALAVNNLLGTNAVLLTNLTNLNTLLSDAAALKTAQGW